MKSGRTHNSNTRLIKSIRQPLRLFIFINVRDMQHGYGWLGYEFGATSIDSMQSWSTGMFLGLKAAALTLTLRHTRFTGIMSFKIAKLMHEYPSINRLIIGSFYLAGLASVHGSF